LADSLQKQKHFPEARQLAEEAASLYQRHPEWPTDEREHAFRVLTTVLTDLGDLSAIELSLRRCLAWAREVWTNNPAKLEEYIAQLADVLRREKKYLEAEPLYREALDSALRFASHSSSRLETRISDVATVLEKQGKRRETEQFYRKLVPTGLENDPTNRIIAAARAGAFSRRGQWKEAITHFTAMLELQPTNHNNYRLLAPLLVAAGDVAGYRRLCRQMLDRFHGTTNRAAAATTVKACLILPPAGLELEAFDELAETAIGGQTNADLFIWAEFTKGLTDFRLGRFGSAVEWMEKVSVKRPNPRLGTATHAVLAMAHYRLKHTEQAQTALAKGVETAEKLPKLQDGDLGINWNDWIIAQALLEEAKALIEGAAHTKATTE
jgi:tetratricopeptide (TPR) repeat protein